MSVFFLSLGKSHVTRIGRVSSEYGSLDVSFLHLCHSLVCVQRLLTPSHVAARPAGM